MPRNTQKKGVAESAKAQQLEVIVDPEHQAAKFANSVKIWHTPYEFYLDFGQFIPGTNKIKVNARIVITPQHALSLHAAISDNLAKYEQRFGKIDKGKQGKEKSEETDTLKRHTAEYVG